MRFTSTAWASSAAAMMIVCAAVAAPAARPALTALARLEPGLWHIKTVGSSAAPRAVCVSDPSVLIQYGHANARCRHAIVANEIDLATVHYACAGLGQGQTSFKVATPHAFNLDTQGILNGAPFDEQYEARRVGTCVAGSTAAR